MTIVEQITQQLLVWLTLTSSTHIPVEVLTQPHHLPSVYVIPQKELTAAVCGCECSVSGIYLGGQDHRIVLGGDEQGRLMLDTSSKGVHLHELKHYEQHLRHDLYSEPLRSREEYEKEAYEVQNEWLFLHGYWKIDIEDSVNNSVSHAAGKVECLNDSISTPLSTDKMRDMLESIIFKYRDNRKLRIIYQSRSNGRKP